MMYTVAILAVVVGILLYVGDQQTSFRFFSKGDVPGLFAVGRSKALDLAQVERFTSRIAGNEDVDMVDAFYNIATDFYEYGWGQSFHFAHTMLEESHDDSIIRHEKRIVDNLGMKTGMKTLDVGCGVGGPARVIAGYSQSNVVGITINKYQIERAEYHTEKLNLTHLIDYVNGDFTKLSQGTFETESFDAAYAIEATCHAVDLADVYGEVFKVLKPGALFGSYEWLKTPNFDETSEYDQETARLIEYGNSLPPLRSIPEALAVAEKVGFEVLEHYDLAEDKEGTRTWYHRIDTSGWEYYLTHATCWITETLGMAEAGTTASHSVLLKAIDGLVRGGRDSTFTPMYWIKMRKPLEA